MSEAHKAKTTNTAKGEDTIKCPSIYGSHTSMINQDVTSMFTDDPDLLVLTDERGDYLTERFRLDKGMADPNRHASIEWRVKNMVEHGVEASCHGERSVAKVPPPKPKEEKAEEVIGTPAESPATV